MSRSPKNKPAQRAAAKLAALAAALVLAAGPAHAAGPASAPLTLEAAWQATLEHDPTYQAALAERDAGLENRALGRAGLLPQISASFGRTRQTGTLETPGPRDTTTQTDLHFYSRTNQIQLSQSVFDFARIAEARAGYARAAYSLAQFDTSAQDTATRLVARYLQVLLAHSELTLAEKYLHATEQLAAIAARRYQAGEGTRTDQSEAESRRDLARADLINAQSARVIAARELQEMLGAAPSAIQGLRPGFAPEPLAPAELTQWLALALEHSPAIHSGAESTAIAEREIERSFGGHLPTLDLIASRRVVQAESISTRTQDSASSSIGLQLSVPIFSGGQTHAQVEQARHNRDRAGFELAATVEQAEVDITRHYQGVVSGAQRIAALALAVKTNQETLRAMQISYEAGVRSISDIVDTQDQLYRAARDLASAQLKYVESRLNLLGAAGILDGAALAEASRAWFGQNPIALR